MKLPFDSLNQLAKLNANKVSNLLRLKFKLRGDEVEDILALMQDLSDVRLDARLRTLGLDVPEKGDTTIPGSDCEFEVNISFPFARDKSKSGLVLDTTSWWLLVTGEPLASSESSADGILSSELIALKRLGRLASKSRVSIALRIPEDSGLERFRLVARLLNDKYLGIETSITHTVSLSIRKTGADFIRPSS
jgi:hypothetical protein